MGKIGTNRFVSSLMVNTLLSAQSSYALSSFFIFSYKHNQLHHLLQKSQLINPFAIPILSQIYTSNLYLRSDSNEIYNCYLDNWYLLVPQYLEILVLFFWPESPLVITVSGFIFCCCFSLFKPYPKIIPCVAGESWQLHVKIFPRNRKQWDFKKLVVSIVLKKKDFYVSPKKQAAIRGEK